MLSVYAWLLREANVHLSRALEESGLIGASYGPAGYVQEGAYYTRRERAPLAESYRYLENALTLLRLSGREGFACHSVLRDPYLGDPADPSIVAGWRKREDVRAFWHDEAVERLSLYLRNVDLFVVWPRRMTSQEEKHIKERNDEFFALYQKLREEGKKKSAAVKDAATMTGYSEGRAWQIVKTRSPAPI